MSRPPIDAAAPFHAVVAAAQRQLATSHSVTLTGPAAPTAAARLLRIAGDVVVVVALETIVDDDDAARAARDAVALASISGGRAVLEVATWAELARVLDAVRELLRAGAAPGTLAAYLGGDLFAAQLPLTPAARVEVRVRSARAPALRAA